MPRRGSGRPDVHSSSRDAVTLSDSGDPPQAPQALSVPRVELWSGRPRDPDGACSHVLCRGPVCTRLRVLPDSYHLVRFDSEDGTFTVELEDVPQAAYTHVKFGIGVDSAANATVALVGDPDPNGRMAWGWKIGYKFVLVEGGLDLVDRRIPLVYHIGFDENYREVSIPLDAAGLGGEDATIRLCADLQRMFDGDQAIDMSEISNVTSEGAASRLLADNYGSMVSRCPAQVGGA